MKLSIVIPAYNTGKYIRQCIDSVLEIRDTEYELIVVNDGSTDETEDILKDYAKRNSHIKIINQNNKGAASARNRGVKESEGDYIYFLDSDDWIETGSFKKIIESLEEDYKKQKKIDVVVGKEKGYSEFTGEEITDERIPGELIGKTVSGKEFMEKALKGKFWNVRLPIYLYRKELFTEKGILFPEGRRSNEDEIFSINVFYNAEKLKITDEIFGYYRARTGSIMSELSIVHSEDIFENAVELIKIYKNEKDEKTRNMIFYMIKKYYKSSMKKAIQCNRKDVFNKIYRQFRKDCRDYLFGTKYKKNENIGLYVVYYTGSLIFSLENNIKKYRKNKKEEKNERDS